MDIHEFLDYSFMMQNKRKEKERLLQSKDLKELRIAVLCGSTFGEIQDCLEIFLLYYGIKPVFYIGEYNRFFEESCFPNESLRNFSPDMIFLHMTSRNLLYQRTTCEICEQTLTDEKNRLIQMWQSLEEQYHCVVIQNNFEYPPYRMIGNAARTRKDGNIYYIDRVNNFITEYVQVHQNIFINDIHYLAASIGLKSWYDDRMWYMYKYPMSMTVIPHYALNIANIIKSVLGKNKKAIITDLDNTLWGGIIGDEGVENIKLGNQTPQGEAYTVLQRYLKYLSQHGVLLNICSKNEYETGMSGIHSRESVLDESDFVINKINWNEKYKNIKEIARELNLLEDSLVFIDDNQVECDSVKSMIPRIEVLQVKKIEAFLKEMDEMSFFEITTETKEDSERKQYYKDNIARREEQKQYQNYYEYLQSLHMMCYIDYVNDTNIERVVQLFNKTNQFNFLTRRYTIDEMKCLVNVSDIVVPVLSLEDKFGNNGIVSAAIIRFGQSDAYIDGWIMSCRVFERKLEFVMLELICELCEQRKIKVLHGYYRETMKNGKISSFYSKLGFFKEDYETENNVEEWTCNDLDKLSKLCLQESNVISRVRS